MTPTPEENKLIDLAHTVMGMHIHEDGSKNQIAAMLDFASIISKEKETRIAELEKEVSYAMAEGERLSKVATYWQGEFYKIKPAQNIVPKIDNL